MAIVNVNHGESIESALRRFKRKVISEEIIKDVKRHAHFIPPTQRAKLKSAMARKRNRRKARPRVMGNNQNQPQGGGGGGYQNQNQPQNRPSY